MNEFYLSSLVLTSQFALNVFFCTQKNLGANTIFTTSAANPIHQLSITHIPKTDPVAE